MHHTVLEDSADEDPFQNMIVFKSKQFYELVSPQKASYWIRPECAEGRLSSRLSAFEFSGLPEIYAALVLPSHFPTASCYHSDLIF